ncbi:MAG: AAA family ATPase [SAR324 cluster bacterium]|nr:AAA family ATPase [SAR324 cluster bacterium]
MKNSPIYVGGSSKGVGKTFVALGLLHLLRKKFHTVAWKPVDVGHLAYNAADVLSDGQRLHRAAEIEEHPNLVNPFLLNEDFPPILAARRDGIALKSDTLQDYFKSLSARFEQIVIEGGRGLLLPLTESQTELGLLSSWKAKVIWVTNIGEHELADTLLQIQTLKKEQIEITGIILSNRENNKNAELIYYQWLTLEEKLSVTVLALLPFLESGLEKPDAIGNLLEKQFDKKHLGLFERIA